MSLNELKKDLMRRKLGARQQETGQQPGGERTPVSADFENYAAKTPDLERSAAEEERLRRLESDAPGSFESLQKLNRFQLNAVLAESSTLVRAQVGSGKTTVLIEKIAHLMRTGVPAEEILVFTFTRKAAREIQERLKQTVGEESGLPSVGTFHSQARDLISHCLDLVETGRGLGFEVLDELSRTRMLRSLVESQGLTIKYPKKLSRRLEAAKSGQVLFGNMKREDDIRELLKFYEDEKRVQNSFDFDDLITYGAAAAQSLEPSKKPTWLLVDELQDTDMEQVHLLKAWSHAETRFFGVGDPDQVIYSWRGSGQEVFESMRECFSCEVFELPVNYRSSANILEAARFVLGISRQGDELFATREPGMGVGVREHFDVVSEAQFIHSIAKDLSDSESLAVLVRTRQQLDLLESHLVALGRKVHRFGLTQNDALREFSLAYFRWLKHPVFEEKLDTWLQDPEFGSPSYLSAVRRCANGETSDWRMQELKDVFSRWHGLKSPGDCKALFSATNLMRFLSPLSHRAEFYEATLLGWLDHADTSEAESFLVSAIEILSKTQQVKTAPEPGPGLHLMTMHASKGLEFDRVFLSGVNKGLMPLASSYSESSQEAEERRLLFVAMTRTRHQLEIGWHRVPSHGGAAPEPSPYLSLIPEVLTQQEHDDDPNESSGPAGPRWGPGLEVQHKRYGKGVIVEFKDDIVTCVFAKGQEKSFSASLCPLKLI